jgi:hypothetical protein
LLPINSSQFPPKFKAPTKKKHHSGHGGTTARVERANARTTSLFRECVFVLVRVAPPDWAVDFNSNEIEKSIRANGGQILSLKLLEAIKVDQAAKAKQQCTSTSKDYDQLQLIEKRKCYVICWGEYSSSHITMNPLLSQVKRLKLCDLEEVTPIWLKTCIAEQKSLSSSRLMEIFKPHGHPIHFLPKQKQVDVEENSSIAGGKSSSVRISVTGFTGTRRAAVVHLVQAMDGIYDDSMKTSTTHLICREAVGPKYEKAIEWNIHVVSIEWLYHISQYGYCGIENNNGQGCESRFSISPTKD